MGVPITVRATFLARFRFRATEVTLDESRRADFHAKIAVTRTRAHMDRSEHGGYRSIML